MVLPYNRTTTQDPYSPTTQKLNASLILWHQFRTMQVRPAVTAAETLATVLVCQHHTTWKLIDDSGPSCNTATQDICT